MNVFVTGGFEGQWPAYVAADEYLRGLGHRVRTTTRDDRVAIRRNLRCLLNETDAIALLPGWQDDSIARLELRVALAIGLSVLLLSRETVPDSMTHQEFDNSTARGLYERMLSRR